MARYSVRFVEGETFVEFPVHREEYFCLLSDADGHIFGRVKGGFTDWEVFSLFQPFDPKRLWLGLGLVRIPGPWSNDSKSGQAFIFPPGRWGEEKQIGNVQGSTIFSGNLDAGYVRLISWDSDDEKTIPETESGSEREHARFRSMIQDRQMVIAGGATLILRHSPKAPPAQQRGFLGLFRR